MICVFSVTGVQAGLQIYLSNYVEKQDYRIKRNMTFIPTGGEKYLVKGGGNLAWLQAFGILPVDTSCPEDADAEAYFTAYGITDDIEKEAVCNLITTLKNSAEGDMWNDDVISAALMSPTRIGFAVGHKDAKEPNDVNFDMTIYGASPNTVSTTSGWKGVLGNSNIAHPLWKLSSIFNNDDFGFTVYTNSFETGFLKIDVGVFAKAPGFRLESFLDATNATFVTGGGGTVPHGGLAPHVFTFRRDNDGTRFNQFYVDGVQVGARFDNPTDIIDLNPAANLKIGIMGGSGFGTGTGTFFSDRRMATVITHHPLNDAKALIMNNAVVTYNANVIPGGR